MKLMNSRGAIVGFYGSSGGKDIAHIGEVIGYMAHPTYIIQKGDEQVYWAECLCREATADETIEYWKQRALKAEGKQE